MKNVSNFHLWLAALTFLSFSLACALTAPQAASVTPLPSTSTQIISTRSLQSAGTDQAPDDNTLPTQTASPSEKPQIRSFDAHVNVQSMLLRSGPGTLYPIVNDYPQGSIVSVVGRAAGDEWVKVETTDQRYGWMLSYFLDLSGNISDLPFEMIKDSHTIHGSILDEAGLPVDQINLAIYQEDKRTDAHTNTDGNYYAYLPVSSQGTWTIEIVGYGCASRIMQTDDCRLAGYFMPSEPVLFSLPAGTSFDFKYLAP